MDSHIKQHSALRKIAVDRLVEIYDVAHKAMGDVAHHTAFKMRHTKLEETYDQFNVNHNAVMQGLSEQKDAITDQDENLRTEVDSKYYSIKTIYYELFEKTDIIQNCSLPNAPVNVRLPKLTVPSFNGDLKLWPTFIDLYKSLIHNNTALTNIERFQYLLSSLEGGALHLAENLPLTSDNYTTVYKNLTKRYQNERLLATFYWEQIHNVTKLQSESSKDLRHILDVFADNLAALKNLNLPVDEWDFVLFHLLSKKIDVDTLKRFELDQGSSSIPKYQDLFKFLEKQCCAYDSVALVQLHKKSSNTANPQMKHPSCKKSQFENKSRASSSFLASAVESIRCPVCKNEHSVYKCPLFLSKSPKDRYELCKQSRWCTYCLGSKHTFKACTSTGCCKVCHDKRHHSLLCFEERVNPPTVAAVDASSNSDNACQTQSPFVRACDASQVLTNVLPSNSSILLSTALVDVVNSRGNVRSMRVLLDSASQASFISERCANKLGLPRSKMALSISGLGHMASSASHHISCLFKPHGKSNPTYVVQAVVLPKICADMPTCTFSLEQWPHLANLELADNNFNVSSPIDMLLGADIFANIMRSNKLMGRVNEPTAIETELGWIVMGKITPPTSTSITLLLSTCNSLLEDTLRRFWELEDVPGVSLSSPDDKKCEAIFQETHYRNSTGHYVVALPFREPQPYFGDSRSIAISRFHSLERRLLKSPNLHAEYSEFLKDYLISNHMEAVQPPTTHENICYIPHHCVTNPNSCTTKLRVVFDASCTYSMGKSFNETLLVGKKLQQDIIGILLRFRLHEFVFISDIKQMYRQILEQEEHQDFQRIVWRFSPNDPLQDFRLKTVTFGVSSSPFLALRVISQLASDESRCFPLAADVLSNDIYIDDIITGRSTLKEILVLQKELISLLKLGGFELRKWASNHPDLLKSVPASDCHQSPLSFDDNEFMVKVLGLRWNPALDSFLYEIQPLSRPCTKRTTLSELSKMFDPLGYLTPLSFFAKHLIQRLWTLGLGWDESPPLTIINEWTRYLTELPCLEKIQIPRCFPQTFLTCQLHGFADSSEKGYAAVVYLRFDFPNETAQVFIICGKSRVAPLKVQSIPRLELCAALLLANLMHLVMNVYQNKLHIDNIFAWSDSTVALSWIKSPPYNWKTFVANRVSYIQDKISSEYWFHVKSTDNPSDCSSRGLLPADLLNNPLWFNGPSWLIHSQDQWPISSFQITPLELEAKTKVLGTFLSLDSLDRLLNKYSSLDKIKRIISYVLRYIHNSRNPMKRLNGPFSIIELHKSLMVLVKRVQHLSFAPEIERLENSLPVPKGIQKFNPFFGEDNILRVGGRLQFSGLAYDHKHLALLPRSHRLTELLIQSTHSEFMHPGMQTVYFLLLQNFWILSAKRAIRQVLSKCYRCFRMKPSSTEPFMGDLPPLRISQIKPFSCVGIDYGGPFLVTPSKGRGVKSQKAYLCLFVCFATKAIHLEAASDLSADAFLAALRRFIARRGRCSRIYCDQATNFVGTSRTLRKFMQDVIESEKISFFLNVPGGPHLNGLSKAGIKSAKSHLLRVVGNQILTFEEFYTLLVQVEAILNSRRLYSLSSDPNDLSVLTLGHFLTLEPLTAVPEGDLSHLKYNQLDRWQLIQRFQQDIWKRWHTEYLNTLQQRSKWLYKGDNLEPGTLVLIKSENIPPLHRRLGRIEKLFPGTDGVARVANVRTSQGLLQRPLVKLCPLPSRN